MLLERFGAAAQGLRHKSSATDPVSDADREAESVVVATLRSEVPEDGILGEESAERSGTSGRRWIVDPLDGTVNFLYGIPQFAVSVALEDDQGIAVGVVRDPVRRETFRAVRGGGCELNGAPVRVRQRDSLDRALIATGFSYEARRRAAQAEVIARVLPHVRDIRRAGAAALDLAWLAAGRVDGYYERGLEPWDWAAGRLLTTEAGGAVAELEGDPPGLVAASPALLPALAKLVV